MAVPGRIGIRCACGARLSAPVSSAGRSVRCPKCAQPIAVPSAGVPELLPEPAVPDAVGPPAPDPDFRILSEERPEGGRRYLRWMLALSLVPLVTSIFSAPDNMLERLQRTLKANPDAAAKVQAAETKEDLLGALPDGRIEGALHSGETWVHWLYALVSAAAFWGFILLVYPLGRATSRQLWTVGLLVGTIGILLLLAVQWVAQWTQGYMVTGRSLLMIVFYIAKFIGFSYRSALDPGNGFLLSLLGFTFGVGLCEELCKSLPVIWHYRKKAMLDVRGAAVWGLATGIGFGVSEGITYASDFYNGFSTGGIYVVRFVSCVALHAVWSGASAIIIWRFQEQFQAVDAWYDWFVPILRNLGISMVLHGLYDTFLKRDMEVAALVTAVVSFVWLFWLYERLRRSEAEVPGLAPAST